MAAYIKLNTLYLTIDAIKNIYLNNEKSLFDYKRIGIDIGKDIRKNLSHLMYSIVEKTASRTRANLVYVDPNSYCQTRHIVIDTILRLTLDASQRGLSVMSLKSLIEQYIGFVDWLNDEEIALPTDMETARDAYMTFSLYLKNCLRENTLKHGTAHIKQVKAAELLVEMFNDTEYSITAHIDIIPEQIPGVHNNKTVVNEEVEYAIKFYYSYFDQVADFILEQKTYPYKLELPDMKAMLFPNNSFPIRPLRKGEKHLSASIDIDTGVILSEEETISKVKNAKDWNKLSKKNQAGRIDKAVRSRQKVLQDIERANQEISNDTARYVMGQRALKAYFMVLLALTAMNDVGLAMMPWDDSYLEEKQTQGFKTIKSRAKNKKVFFEIQNEFMPSFKKFLKLREFLLNEKECKYLFFTGYGDNIKISKFQEAGMFSVSIYNGTFRKFNPKLPRILSKDFRAHKIKWVLKKYGLAKTTIISQNSMEVLSKYYNGEKEEEQKGQLGHFLDAVHSRVSLDKREETDTNIIAGTCSNYGTPSPTDKEVPVVPDCAKPEGCFFCTYHRVHDDEIDIRKLLSLEYIIKEISISNARSQEHFDQVMGPVLKRINQYLDVLRESKKDMGELINKIRIDVFENENLTWYWERKLIVMYNLGIVR